MSFEFRPVDAEDAQQVAQTLATLSQAGWKVSAETASEMLGFEVEESATNSIDPTSIYALRAAGYAPEERSLERATGWPLNPVQESGAAGVMRNRATAPAEEAPLTQEELDALALVQNAMDPDVLRKKAAAIAGRLYEEMQTGRQSEIQETENVLEFVDFRAEDVGEKVANCNQYKHDEDCNVGDIIANVRNTPSGQALQSVLDAAHNSAQPSTTAVILQPLNDRTIARAKEQCGRDLSEYDHVVSPSAMRHDNKRRPNFTDDEYMLMLDMQSNWDDLVYTTPRGEPSLEYHKTYEGKEYVLVERIGNGKDRHHRHKMHFKTEYTDTRDKKRRA